MRLWIPALVAIGLFLGAPQAEAASCSAFAKIKQFDGDAFYVKVKFEKGSESRFFPKTEGTPANNSKLPAKCKTRLTKKKSVFKVKAVGGRMSVTQVRMNFSGKMLNDIEDEGWLAVRIKQLIADGTKVAIVLRESMGKDSEYEVTTIYMPITDEEKAEIARLDAQGEDVD